MQTHTSRGDGTTQADQFVSFAERKSRSDEKARVSELTSQDILTQLPKVSYSLCQPKNAKHFTRQRLNKGCDETLVRLRQCFRAAPQPVFRVR